MKRPYSREFPTKGPRQEKRRSISIDGEYALLSAFRQRVKALGLTQRTLLLRWIRNFTEGRRPDEDSVTEREQTP